MNLSPPPPTNDDEVPSEDSVQFGLAKGTTNTYAIPGMDEMTPEEYRKKLQETISGRQVSTMVAFPVTLSPPFLCAQPICSLGVSLPGQAKRAGEGKWHDRE